jgi:GNAT superfamily N-acetyltransferase
VENLTVSTVSDHDGRVRVTEVRAGDGTDLSGLAAVCRLAFATGDLLPGLPAAEGTADTAASLDADLAAGIRLWQARGRNGAVLGTIRVVTGAVWHLRRLAVRPGQQGRGVGRALVAAVDAAAVAAGAARLDVWAVVERGVPPFYSALGWRTTGHIPNPEGKPLSEAVMTRRPGSGFAPLAYPWGTEASAVSGVQVSWFATAAGTRAVLDRVAGDPEARAAAAAARLPGPVRFLGGDVWSDAGAGGLAVLRGRLAGAAEGADGPVLAFPAAYRQVRPFTQPRLVEPGLLAMWRVPER